MAFVLYHNSVNIHEMSLVWPKVKCCFVGLIFLAPTGAQEMQIFVRSSEAKCSIAHNLNLLGSDYIKMTLG